MARISLKIKTILARALRRTTKRPFLKPPVPQPGSVLLSLPPEILCHIVDLADAASAACLALTCKGAYLFVSTPQVFPLLQLEKQTVNPKHQQRRDFLLSYAKDRDDGFFCHRCYKLHSPKTANPPGPLFQVQKRRPCFDRPLVRSQYHIGSYGHLHRSLALDGHASTYDLEFQHVQLALDEHRRPGSGLPLEALKLVELAYPKGAKSGSNLYCTLSSYEVAVVEGELYLRVQQWLVVSKKAARERKTYSSTMKEPDVNLCTHVSFCSARSAMDSEKPRDWFGPYKDTLYYCSTCQTEWMFDTKYIGRGEDDRVVLVISKCYNVGDGVSPKSRVWKRHTDTRPWGYPCVVPDVEASMMHRFEEASTTSLTYRTMENHKMLSRLDKKLVPHPEKKGNPWIETWIYQIETRAGRKQTKPQWRRWESSWRKEEPSPRVKQPTVEKRAVKKPAVKKPAAKTFDANEHAAPTMPTPDMFLRMQLLGVF